MIEGQHGSRLGNIMARWPFLRFSIPQFSLENFYRLMAKQLVYILYNVRFLGFSQIPETGPALLIANHVSYVDGLIINALCKRKVRYIIDKDIFELPVVHYFMSMNRSIPIAPKRDSVTEALNEISEGLKAGDVICIFPEGQLTSNGYMSHFRPGIEWIINRDPVPIYPIALHGLWGSIFSRKHKGSWLRFVPKGFRCNVTALCGKPIDGATATVDSLQLAVLELRNMVADG